MQSLSRSPSPPPSISLCHVWRKKRAGGSLQLAGAPAVCFSRSAGAGPVVAGEGERNQVLMLSAGEVLARANTNTPARPSLCPNLGRLDNNTTSKKMPNAFVSCFCEFAPSVCRKGKRAAAHTRAHAHTRSCEPEIHWAAG